jgi:L-serine dehydratase
MSAFSILNDVMGPVMRGPSSSHTAGAFRIGRIAAMLADEPLARVRVGFDPTGSYAPTYHAMGVDAAFAAAFLGLEMEDDRYTQAPAMAAARGIELTFCVEPLEFNDHPNTIRLEIITRSGATHVAWARSIGGGMVDVYRFDDWLCRLDGKSWTLLIKRIGGTGGWLDVSRCVGVKAPAQHDQRAGAEFAQYCLLDPLSQETIQMLQALAGVRDVRHAEPLMHVPKGAALFSSAREMLEYAAGRPLSLGEAACAYETALLDIPESDIVAEMSRRYGIMRAAVAQGLDDSRVHMPLLSPSASSLWRAEQEGHLPHGGMLARAVARSLAALHVCNSKGVVCAAPTGGSSGVIPGVLVTLAEERKLSERQTAMALLAAGADRKSVV